AFGYGGNAFTDALEVGQRYAGVGVVGPFGVQERGPVGGVLVLVVGKNGFDGALTVVEQLTVGLDHLIGFVFREHALRHQLVGVQLARTRMLADGLVHERLGERRGVLF